MTEDILEQIGADWLLSNPGTFIKTNLKYRPLPTSKEYNQNQDQIHSDIDIISINISKLDTIKVFNCKSWLDGFDCRKFLEKLNDEKGRQSMYGGKPIWKHFRELTSEKWADAFIARLLKENPHAKQIEYYVLCIKSKNKEIASEWIELPVIQQVFRDKKLKICKIGCKDLNDIIKGIAPPEPGTVVNSHIGRTLQILSAANKLNN